MAKQINTFFIVSSFVALASCTSKQTTRSSSSESNDLPSTDILNDILSVENAGVLYKKRQLIVRLADTLNADDTDQMLSSANLANLKTLKVIDRDAETPRLFLLETRDDLSAEYMESLATDPAVERVQLNYIYKTQALPDDKTQALPDDPLFSSLWGLYGIAGVNAPIAWDATTGSNEIVAAVIDTGIDYDHPDLVDNLWVNPNEIPDDGIDNDQNGYIDDIYGINAIVGSGDPDDDNSHGSHVAGTIGARGNNNIGITGVNWNVKIISCKFLNRFGSGSLADAITCFRYLYMMKHQFGVNIKVINNSWGGGGFSQDMKDAIEGLSQPGTDPILNVMAAGNSGRDNDSSKFYPASYDSDNILSVAAIDENGSYARFTNYGRTTVDIAAPGVTILSTTPGGGYGNKSGTSMAAPHAAGAAALIAATAAELSAIQLKDRMMEGATPLSDTSRATITNGRLDLENIDFGPLPDTSPPGRITDLTVVNVLEDSYYLQWIEPGNDGFANGPVSRYEIRVADQPIRNEDDWEQASPIENPPLPSAEGELLLHRVAVSEVGEYHYAVKSFDSHDNVSVLSNTDVANTKQAPINFPPKVRPITVSAGAGLLAFFKLKGFDKEGETLSYKIVRPPAKSYASIDVAGNTFAFQGEVSDSFLVAAVTADGDQSLPVEVIVTVIQEDTPFEVTRVEATDSTVQVQFSKPIFTKHINLYTGMSNKSNPDFEILDPLGNQVRGSLVFDTENYVATFVKTSGPFLAGTHSLKLSSQGAVGFHTRIHKKFERLVSGPKFETSFEIGNASGPLISIPHITRGPGQEVRINGEAGVPVMADVPATYDGSSSASFEVNFDQYHIQFAHAVDIGRDLAKEDGWQAEFELEGGLLKVRIHSPQSIFPKRRFELARLYSKQPTQFIPSYGSTSVLRVKDVRWGGLSTPRSTSSVHTFAYIGDATANQDYSAFDSSLVARVAVGKDLGFDSYLMIDPVLIGDVTNDGSLSGLDASWIARKAVGLPQPEIPDLP